MFVIRNESPLQNNNNHNYLQSFIHTPISKECIHKLIHLITHNNHTHLQRRTDKTNTHTNATKTSHN